MQVLYEVCCGLDVHKNSVVACLRVCGASGEPRRELRTFSTTTAGLLELADWLAGHQCQHVAMESTGVFWKPVYNLLEGVCQQVLLVNAQHVKQVPGRKTDLKDAEWIAELLAVGLLRASFIPPAEIRDLRELTRYRSKVVKQRADQCNRIQKLLESGNIKLASVATDILGVSGWAMLEALAQGETDSQKLAEMARGPLRRKIPQLRAALQGRLTATQRWLLAEQLAHVADLDQRIAKLNGKIEELCAPFFSQIEKLAEIPGVSRRVAEIVIAEIGTDMSRFPDDEHLASWAGMCPGNHESAGKRFSGKRRKGSTWLRAALTEAGWAASHTRNTYLSAQYHQIRRRRGSRRACVAVGHSILVMAYHLLSDTNVRYEDLGPDYFEKHNKVRLAQHLVHRLQQLGFHITFEVPAA
jgi:transposase